MDQVLNTRENWAPISLVAEVLTLLFGVSPQWKGRIWKRQFPPQLCRQPPTPQPLQRMPSQTAGGQRAKSFGQFHVGHRGGSRRVSPLATNSSSILYSKPFDQQSLAKHPTGDLWSKHRGQNLFLRGLCDVWAWCVDAALGFRDLSQIIGKWLAECERVEGSAPCATAPALPLPCQSRHKTTSSEPQMKHNALSNSKFFSKSSHSQSSLDAAPETLWNTPFHQSVTGQESHSEDPTNHAFLPRITVVFLGESHGRIALCPRGESAGVFSLSLKNALHASGAFRGDSLSLAFCQKTKIFLQKLFPKTFLK